MGRQIRNVCKKLSCTGMMFALLFTGSAQIPAAPLVEEDTDMIISQFLHILNVTETKTNLELTFPVKLSQDEDQGDWLLQVEVFEDQLIQSVEKNLSEVFGQEQYTAAEYPIPLTAEDDGTAMYWYSSETSELLAMQLQRGDSLYDWTLSLSWMPYEAVTVDIAGLPFELEYNMNDGEIRAALAGKAVCSGVIEEGDMMENSIYTVFLPEDEYIEYIQIAAQSLDHMKYLPLTYPDVDLDIPSDRKLWKVYYYLSHDVEPDMVLELLNATWENGIAGKVDEGNGWKEEWYANVETESMMDAAVLKEAFPEDAWNMVWNMYEKIRFEYGHATEPPCITYAGEAQVMIPVMLEGLEKMEE